MAARTTEFGNEWLAFIEDLILRYLPENAVENNGQLLLSLAINRPNRSSFEAFVAELKQIKSCLLLSLLELQSGPRPEGALGTPSGRREGRRSATAEPAAATLVLGLVHAEIATAELGAVERLDGTGRSRRLGHLDEGEAARPPRVSVHDHIDGLDITVRSEDGTQIGLSRGKRNIAYVDFLAQWESLPRA